MWRRLGAACALVGMFLAGCGPAAPSNTVPSPQPPPTSTAAVVSTPPPPLNITATLPAAVLPTPLPVLGPISFASPTLGWAAGGPPNKPSTWILRTDNGGHTWHRTATLPAAVSSLAFTSDRTGWATVGRGSLYAGGQLYRTADGGRTWTAIGVAASVVSFADARHGWVAAANAQGRPPALERTSDGGRNWTRVADPCTSVHELFASLSAPSPATVWVLCTGLLGAGMQDKTVFSGSDGGQAWDVVARVRYVQSAPPTTP